MTTTIETINVSRVEKAKDFPTRQKNMAIYADVLSAFEGFCSLRNLAEGQSASVALYRFMKMTAVEREDAALEMKNELGGPGDKYRLKPPDEPPPHRDLRRDAAHGPPKEPKKK